MVLYLGTPKACTKALLVTIPEQPSWLCVSALASKAFVLVWLGFKIKSFGEQVFNMDRSVRAGRLCGYSLG